MAMNSVELNRFVKDTVVSSLCLTNAEKIGDFTYVIPVETENGTVYGKVAITACQVKDTKKVKAFDLTVAQELYRADCQIKEAKAAERAAAKAAKSK